MWKKKEKKTDSSGAAVPDDGKKAEPNLSTEEIQRLEESKHKLFSGFMSRKPKVTSKIEALQGQFESGSKSQPPVLPLKPTEKPTPPKKPQRPDIRPPSLPTNGITPERNGKITADRQPSGESGLLSPDFLLSSPVGEAVGFHSDSLKNFSLPGLNLPILKRNLQTERTVAVQRHTTSGDFGFSIRRAQFIERNSDFSEKRQVVIFAEPIAVGAQNKTGLLPGDQLLEVNGVNVANMVKEQIIGLIKSSGDKVTLKV